MNKFLEKLQIKLTPRFIRRIQRIENQININALTIQNELNRFEEIGNKLNELDNQIILNRNEIYNYYDNIHTILSYSTNIEDIKPRKTILRDIQNISLILLTNFDKIARENNIKYFLQGGGLLAAYRQKRFTVWDDDLDIGVMRKDLNKLFMILEKHPLFELKYFYHLKWDIPCRMSKFVIKDEITFWIDVFSYDYVNINKEKEDIFWNAFIEKRLLLAKELKDLKYTYDSIPIYDDYDRNITEKIFNKYILEYEKLDYGNYILFGIDNFMSNYKRLFPYDMIFPLNKLEFENNFYPVPNNYESYIYRQYGNPFLFPKFFNKHYELSNYDNLKMSIDRIYKKLKDNGINWEYE